MFTFLKTFLLHVEKLEGSKNYEKHFIFIMHLAAKTHLASGESILDLHLHNKWLKPPLLNPLAWETQQFNSESFQLAVGWENQR